MRYADSAERRTFGKVECVKSVFAFLFNYLILLLLVALFIWMNTLAIEGRASQITSKSTTTLSFTCWQAFSYSV